MPRSAEEIGASSRPDFQAQGTAFDGGEILEQALEHATTATVRVRGSSRRLSIIWCTSKANRSGSLRPDSEVYNEKIYDLLESPLPSAPPSTPAAPSHSHGGGGGMFKGLFKNFVVNLRVWTETPGPVSL
jgi:hypothetical protein